MKIIVGHKNPDFDCFASCVAVRKLYPDYTIVLSGTPQQNLAQYLAIYEEKYPFITEKDLADQSVESVIVVDTASKERLGVPIQAIVENTSQVLIFDHHPDIKEISINGEKRIESVGATTTMLLEEIRKKNISIDSIDATLFAIAIYEDTGNLLYTTTTVRDIEAIKFLLQKGTNLIEVSDFIKYDLNYDQKLIFESLLSNMETVQIDGITLSVSVAETDKFVGGLNAVTSKLWYLEGVETLICIIRTGKKTHIIGRTSSNDVDIGGMITELGGGGHRKAASCTLNTNDVQEVKKIILQTLKKYLNKGLRARDIMSFPVRVAYAEMTIGEVNKIMERTGHNGLPIIEGNKLVGIVTKKAVDRAMNHGLQNAPIKSIMSSKLIVVTPETPLNKVRQTMIENDIGRIPVVEHGVLVGIITRTDVMRSSFTDAVVRPPRKAIHETVQTTFVDVRNLLMTSLPKKVIDLLKQLGQYGDEIGLSVYIVGGFVRDLLMGNPNYDIDIVVERDGLAFAKLAAEKLNARLVTYEKFLTASLFIKNGFRIDVATARTEYYQAPTELPQVEISTIKKDLYRRDFTINAMAIKLNSKDFGTLIDFFGAKKDLEGKLIRCLHTLSFIEDPTRILRAVRFETRFGFKIELQTTQLMLQAVQHGYLEKVTGQRLRQEFEKILEEKDPPAALKRLADFEILKHMFPGVFYTTTMEEKLKSLFGFISWAEEFFEKINRFYCVMFVFLEYHGDTALDQLKERYGLSSSFIDELKILMKMIVPLSKVVSMRLNFSDIHKMTQGFSSEAYCYLASYLDADSQEYLKEYLKRTAQTKLKIKGNFLTRNLGLNPGRVVGDILERLYCAKLDGIITDDQEEEFVRKLISENISSKALEQ
ncbi:MAG TPA: CBS domain-containing protein [Pseudothermotoga sp.]|nr:CBS domain-containing protein [Pseudothermotoga sp.]HOK84389.1 CBS domain-containing protein [Pseudothermotoga sp.]HPP70575.1 CBS domain-containing protein [Pseudothermotoga sp.]